MTDLHTISSRAPMRIASAILAGERFRSGNMWGERVTDGETGHGGQLSLKALEVWRDTSHWADYLVYSYITPIAWHVAAHDDEEAYWIVVEDKFSPTTSRHQNAVLLAMEMVRDVTFVSKTNVRFK